MLASEAFSPTTSGELPSAAGDVYWALADKLGSVRDIVAYDSGTGQTSVVNHIEYDAFGNITGESAATGMDYALERYLYSYTGREWDADAEMYAYRARWYDPVVGRFISEDPIGFAAGDTNISRYVGNGATNATDPSGLENIRLFSYLRSPDGYRMFAVYLSIFVIPSMKMERARNGFIWAGPSMKSRRPLPPSWRYRMSRRFSPSPTRASAPTPEAGPMPISRFIFFAHRKERGSGPPSAARGMVTDGA